MIFYYFISEQNQKKNGLDHKERSIFLFVYVFIALKKKKKRNEKKQWKIHYITQSQSLLTKTALFLII